MSTENNHITDDLLIRHLLGETSEAENDVVFAWIAEDEKNKKHFEQFVTIWQQSKQLNTKKEINVDAAWQKFKENTQDTKPAGKSIALPTRSNSWMRYAASFALLIVAAWAVYFITGREVTIIAENEVISQVLPDGSTVTLNKHATITYSKKFGEENRNLKLDGEAFFDVTPNKAMPFVIDANSAKVKVVGTSFNVNTKREKTEVIVATGIVEVSKKNEAILVNPREKAIVLKSKAAPSKEKYKDVLYNYYKTKEFVCDSTPLWQLTQILEKAYDVNILITDNRLRTKPITTRFSNQPIERVLEIIGSTMNCQIEQNGKHIILR